MTMHGIQIPIEAIRRDGGTQLRAATRSDYIDELRGVLRDGGTLPDVVVFEDPAGKLWLGDGFHTVAAHVAESIDVVNSHVVQGSQRDAVLYAAGANHTHGLRRTHEDKRNAVRTLLGDPEWSQQTDRWIAEKCNVSHPFVASLRNENPDQPASSTTGNVSNTRKGRDGREYKAPTHPDYPAPPIEREPGDDTESEAAAQAAEKALPKPGAPLFDWKHFERDFGALVRQVDALATAYRQKDAPTAERLQRSLGDWRHDIKNWFRQISGQKAPE